jgi:hypothetical protein
MICIINLETNETLPGALCALAADGYTVVTIK